MKRFIVCFVLAISIMLGLCACNPTTTDDKGISRELIYGSFVVLDKYGFDFTTVVVYHKTTSVVYYLQSGSYGGFLTPYQIYQDGQIYGAIYQDGKIVPVPYAYAPLE